MPITITITDEELKDFITQKMRDDLSETRRTNVLRNAVENALQTKAPEIETFSEEAIDEILQDKDFRKEYAKQILKNGR